MPRPEPFALIDTLREGSVSFAPPERPAAAGSEGAASVAVGPGRSAIATPALVGGASRDRVSGYPIQPGKVQRPPLRDETLARHRLLDWLDVKIHNRVVFVIADAGYGKTTLLADFSGRTRLRTLWYRMDEEDRHWVSFMSYLVAAGREHDPEFAPRTGAMLDDTGPGGANRDDVVGAFFKELPTIVGDGAALILDDFHVADDIPDIKAIARELVARAPERLTLVFSSRRMPLVPVARLRSLGEVAELRTADLRFSAEETGALFKDTYGRALEPDVLADLSRRTDGWAASLYLVRAALRDRSAAETRSFVRGLSGAQSDLYDYLAEEVVGDLPDEHQQFLMRTSILQAVEPEAAEVASGLDGASVAALIAESERLGLLSRRQSATRQAHRYHPLVREFLETRLRRDVGDDAVSGLHRDVARWAEGRDWREACFHYAAAGDAKDLHRILDASIESVVGTGEVALAADYLGQFPPIASQASFEVIRSRLASNAVDIEKSVAHARLAVELDPTSELAALNLLGTYFQTGNLLPASDLATDLAASAKSATLRQIGAATKLILDVTLEGDLDQAIASIGQLAEQSRMDGHTHFEGVSLLNVSLIRKAQGDAIGGLRDAGNAYVALSQGSTGWERQSARMAQAWALAHVGSLEEARSIIASTADQTTSETRPEWLLESAQVELWYGSEDAARSLIEELIRLDLTPSFRAVASLANVEMLLRMGRDDLAAEQLPSTRPTIPTQEPGYLSHHIALSAQVALARGDPGAREQALEAGRFASRQGARLWAGVSSVVAAAAAASVSSDLKRLGESGSPYLSIAAEALIARLHLLDEGAFDLVIREAESRPERWRDSLRRVVASDHAPSRQQAARMLDRIGDRADVALLRSVARSRGARLDPTLGRGLARRLASPVTVEDQGRVQIRIGTTVVLGTELRRKVLAMLCFLLTRSGFAATRDEIIDALWPDMAPEVAVNSLNQTVYFLRRVFEPWYKEDLSAGYVHHESDILWLDQELIQSRSQQCNDLISSLGPNPTPADVERLSDIYINRFALDFSYEDWAGSFREVLHTTYVQLVESAVTHDIESGSYERGIRLARRALVIDPDLDNVELSLLRLYRATGAHSAAAEQYAHYATYLREELGIEAPPLTAL